MPGIVGLITKIPRERAERQLFCMVESMRHEQFYVTGTWADEEVGVYVGWVSRKGSFCDEMPLRNERGDLVLFFSGEDFPEPGTRQRLKLQGHELDRNRASYLVHLAEENDAFPVPLNGRFHGLLIDAKNATAALFNDRYGLQRLYYHQTEETFYFAAEAKAILALRPELRKFDSQGLADFLTCGCTLENRTLFHGIRTMPGGSNWLFRNGSLRAKQSYFVPAEWEGQESLDNEQFYRELRDVFSRNLPRYFAGDEPIAMSLTGGLDTRMIMAWQQAAPGALPCYTFGGMLRDCQDVIISREVASACGQSHQVIPAGEAFLSKFPHYAERAVYLTDGCCDASRAPDVHWNELAREIAPSRMTGNYGGELLRQVRTFKAVAPHSMWFSPDLQPFVRETQETYRRALRDKPLSFTMFKQAPWNHYGMLALEQTQLSLRTPFFDNDLVRTVFRAPDYSLAGDEASIRLIADGNKDLLRIRTDRGLMGAHRPFVTVASRLLLEFLFKAEYGYDMGMPQSVARIDNLFRRVHLERLFLGRHKISHFRIWYRDSLAPYLREMLLDPRCMARPHVERKALEGLVQAHVAGAGNYTIDIHKSLTLEIVHRLFFEAAKPVDTARVSSVGARAGA